MTGWLASRKRASADGAYDEMVRATIREALLSDDAVMDAIARRGDALAAAEYLALVRSQAGRPLVAAGSSAKAQLLQQAGRATLCVQREELPYAYVTVEGSVETGATDRATRVDIASRYLGSKTGTQT